MDSMNDFEEVKMYQCKYCGRLFRTTRHKCKFNPERKNCLSCKHCIGFEDLESYKIFLCNIDGMCDEPNVDLNELGNNNWNGFCDHYETMPDYKGKSSYAKIIQQQREKEFEKSWIQETMQ